MTSVGLLAVYVREVSARRISYCGEDNCKREAIHYGVAQGRAFCRECTDDIFKQELEGTCMSSACGYRQWWT
ncbi:hypothetical protein F5884DRAFT_808718 [Xylogone sp. PMI_703]|nr:hypothetical protein F5884DRAFT_808718 [Xylogone sp. PMI_703]